MADISHKGHISDEMLFRFFRGDSTPDEEKLIREWLAADKANEKRYNTMHDLYDAYLITAPAEMLQHYPARHDSRNGGKRKTFRRTVAAVTGIAAAIALVIISADFAKQGIRKEMAENVTTVTVPPGQRMDITLADGTLVKLNSGASISYPGLFSRKERRVHLSGEACFKVTHNEKQPFVVNTYAADVTVLGTEFNVNADEEAGEFSTALIEGRVMVTNVSDGQNVTLAPDQIVTIRDGRFQVDNTDASDSILWTEGIIDIANVDFGTLIRRIEKAYGVDIVVQLDSIPSVDCTSGQIVISDGIDHAMRILSQLSGFTYGKDQRTGTIYIKDRP